mmetsp:Transcript_8238/g.12664  ORF Transcript_8238/g.12664 Transcript_8238/m.12664 type:complete len:389 (+) Transcript_8238:143-1309(+)|eukprot:CAMPEP_0178907148 /NCGR_PEP_ID=MMETSP0786-20121207/7210_1 /TAXON_ID=186022 /ORGANISM="Thalassionema frauenfeldii, Strain CCMP 1798" /LENGTH=388 /DNA_ID=CAMNT_0020578915 /DNA_START=141 /DNA_END=1307 /DNA_ORIENTATION=-
MNALRPGQLESEDRKKFASELMAIISCDCEDDSWQPAIDRLESHPDEVGIIGSLFGQTALHVACIRYPPLILIKKMIALAAENIQHQNSDGETALHIACNCSSPEVQLELIKAGPQAISLRDKYGETPLHYAARNGVSFLVLQSMLEAAPKVVGWNNHKGLSPFELLSRSYVDAKSLEDFDEEDQYSIDFEMSLLFLRSQVPSPNLTPLVHAAAQTPCCPRPFLYTLMKFFPEQALQYDYEGNTPLLHVAASVISDGPTSCWDQELDGYRDQEAEEKMDMDNYTNIDDQVKTVPSKDLLLLMLDWNNQAARMADINGRLPLTHALLHNKKWSEGVENLVLAAPKALATRDPTTLLYPFQLAACVGQDTDTIYNLVRSFPQNIQMAVNV